MKINLWKALLALSYLVQIVCFFMPWMRFLDALTGPELGEFIEPLYALYLLPLLDTLALFLLYKDKSRVLLWLLATVPLFTLGLLIAFLGLHTVTGFWLYGAWTALGCSLAQLILLLMPFLLSKLGYGKNI